MLPIQFPGNSQYMRYEYHRVREGPNYFITYYKNSSRLIYEPKDAWRTLGVAKFTDTGKALKEWCMEMYDKYSLPSEEVGRADTSFASEAQEEPNDNTKMVM
jgi:hypothetical protein